MAVISDGVIVGSALVDRISHLRSGETYSQAALADTVAVISSIRQAIDNIK
jgi:tryptophan synthase alpha subunit